MNGETPEVRSDKRKPREKKERKRERKERKGEGEKKDAAILWPFLFDAHLL